MRNNIRTICSRDLSVRFWGNQQTTDVLYFHTSRETNITILINILS